MTTDVSASRLTASGSLFGGRTRLRGIYYVGTATAGTLQFRNGGASGTVLLTIDTPASATATTDIIFPGDGIIFPDGLYVTMTDVGAVTAFYG